MDDRLFDAAEQGALILTVNDRLARHLSREYDLVQQARGCRAWLRPDILSYAAWLGRLQTRIPGMPAFLNSIQLRHVWEKIVSRDTHQAANPLLNVYQTAIRALQAHHILVRYQADFDKEQSAEDHRAFLRWRNEWKRLSAENGWHDAIESPWLIAEAITDGQVNLPGKILFAGFDDLTPDQEHVCDAVRETGTQLDFWQPEPFAEGLCRRIAADDPVDEVRRCAQWVRDLLDNDPDARIAVVAPQLDAYRGLIEQILAAELEPASLLEGNESAKTFNMSLGYTLDHEGVISAAQKLLRLDRVFEQSDVTWLLHTPYIDQSTVEAGERSKLDRELRLLRRFDWPVKRLTQTIKVYSAKKHLHVPAIETVAETLAQHINTSGLKFPGEWAQRFIMFFRDIGWPGDRSLSSREYQAVDRFMDVLLQMSSLDSLAGEVTRTEATRILSRIVASTEFQPESSHAPVQVLGELEASGLTFDQMWILGLTDTAMPRTPSPNPFIPLTIQKAHKMKRADADREYHFAEQVAARLFTAAPNVFMSWPKQANGAPQRPSPFADSVIEDSPDMLRSNHPALLYFTARPDLEEITDEKGRPVSTRKAFTGGTALIKDQALCPFRAYAHHRLRAEQVDDTDVGIDNMSRGTLVHTVLELFWDDVQDRATLDSFSHDALIARVDNAVDGALNRLERERRGDLPARQRQIERKRLVSLVMRWLDHERNRPIFRVAAAEKNLSVEVGGITIRARIDRIDEDVDGNNVIIDYKTGLTDPAQWLDQRITEPQLPLYSLGMEQQRVAAVMFASVRGKDRERGFRGIARNPDDWSGCVPRKINQLLDEKGWTDFGDVLDHWSSSLAELGNSFATGDAKVDPVDQEKTCRYCDLKSLCRISELASDRQESNND